MRNPADVAGRLVVTAAVAVVVGLVFLGVPDSKCLPPLSLSSPNPPMLHRSVGAHGTRCSIDHQ